MTKKVLCLVIPGLMLGLVLMVRLGLVPVNADAAPSSFEARIFPMILHASVARNARARQLKVSRPLSDENPSAGEDIYSTMCAQCHGRLDGKASLLGASLYPPAPQFPGHPSSYTGPELFWLIKHGIRNTGMPAWGNRLADQDIWDLVSYLKSVPDRSRPD